jgi:hypothetical protein
MSEPVRLTLFNVEDANRLLPELRPELERLKLGKRELDLVEARVEVLSVVTAGASADNPDRAEQRVLAARRDRLRRDIGAGIEAVHRRGVLVKDLDRGLVDFYALRGDRLVFLCWQLGEPEVLHWHSLESGFGGRQRIDRSEAE